MTEDSSPLQSCNRRRLRSHLNCTVSGRSCKNTRTIGATLLVLVPLLFHRQISQISLRESGCESVKEVIREQAHEQATKSMILHRVTLQIPKQSSTKRGTLTTDEFRMLSRQLFQPPTLLSSRRIQLPVAPGASASF